MHAESIQAVRLGHGEARIMGGRAEIEANSGSDARPEVFGAVGLQLAAVAVCLMHQIEEIAPNLGIKIDGVEMSVSADYDSHGTSLSRIGYHIVLRTGASPAQIETLHDGLRSGGSICATIRRAVRLDGVMRAAGTNAHGRIEA
jgi:uncharacterized OsmC-like protein